MNRTNTILLTAATAAVHILDDNMINSNSSVAGHAASTLVPLAATGALAWTAVRTRSGTRAVGALALGLWCAMLGSEALYHTLTRSLGGDDWTGLVCLVAGIWLIATGVRDLWRGRRRDDSRRRRYIRRSLVGLAAFLVTLNVAYPVVEAYIAANVATRDAPEFELGVPHQDVRFPSADGHILDGWYVASDNGAAIILMQGRGGTQDHAQMLIDAGYGVLLFDPRGVGDSGGEQAAWGWGSENDVHGAVEFLRAQPDVDPDRIGGLGLSVGGEALLHAAAENPDLRAVVSEGAGARSWSEYRHLDGAAPWLWGPLAINRTIATAVFGNRMPPPGLHDLAGQIEQPVFFINAVNGLGGESLTDDYYRLASGPKQHWTTETGHTGGLDADPDLYAERVVGFLDQALG